MRFEGLGRADGQLAGWAYGDVAELADALDLGSSTFGVQVQLLSPAPFTLINLGKIFKSFIFFYF